MKLVSNCKFEMQILNARKRQSHGKIPKLPWRTHARKLMLEMACLAHYLFLEELQ
jgi:hypothetical protein